MISLRNYTIGFKVSAVPEQKNTCPNRSIPAAKKHVFAPISALEDRLFETLDARSQATGDVDWKVLLVGFKDYALTTMRQKCEEAGVELIASFGSPHNLTHLSDIKGSFTHIIVNEDAFPSVDVAITRLLDIRPMVTDTALLLVTNRSRIDDFGCERDSLCDGTLGGFLTSQRLRSGLIISAEKVAQRPEFLRKTTQ